MDDYLVLPLFVTAGFPPCLWVQQLYHAHFWFHVVCGRMMWQGHPPIKLVCVTCCCFTIWQALWLKLTDALRDRGRGLILEQLSLQSPVLLTGAYLDLFGTFPCAVCFLISSVAWKLPWSLNGLLYGICQLLSNQVLSLCQMLAIYQPHWGWWHSIISLKLNNATQGL